MFYNYLHSKCFLCCHTNAAYACVNGILDKQPDIVLTNQFAMLIILGTGYKAPPQGFMNWAQV